ncbi:MAG: DegT/DnrJ/EryC1/StrS family aminotransferase [Candidatus Omnitrophica bacterium]|nr:DegT/DnrJ/EryC1/StrS family aminotransferase [Candidatus Omnitrophota bacterium]MBU1995640.1 DegT/DnrJ/EryC1/StrS family aminotransferase [Candidatus Omnitrophota bacterium]MBU4334097.1 DegT/DnrJ/EryC1/StrS family aminotransferase [Candidatus Omnitrophota bacterium]
MKFNIPHSRPTISSKDISSVIKVLRSQHITQGPVVDNFERIFSKYHNVKGSVALNSGTSAIHLSLLALGAQKGDEVIIPSFVCSALLNAVLYTGAKPILADVNNHDFNLSIESVKNSITKKTKAIMVPHMFGLPADIKDFVALGIPIIEDCAQSLGAEYNKQKVGSFGAISVFSFYATKVIATGEGGMVASNNTKLLNKIYDLREYDKKKFCKLGFNYKMTDVEAALGLSQMEKLPELINKRKSIAKIFNEAFSNYNVQIPTALPRKEHIFYRYIVNLGKSSAATIRTLNKKGIHCACPIFEPLHKQMNMDPKRFPNSQELYKNTVSLPIYPSLLKQEVDFIIQSFKNCLEK